MTSSAPHNGPILDTPEQLPGKKPPTRAWRAFLIYDIAVLLLIVVNLLTIAIDHLMFTNIGMSAAQIVDQTGWVYTYREQYHPVIQSLDEWITIYLISELLVRWLVAIIFKHHQRWFFFPFVHWYEFLACIPTFRALRLLRATVIGYRLHQLGYKVLPDSWVKTGLFYYQVVMEELSDRIVLTVLDGVERELKNGATHHHLLHQLVNRHRLQIEQAMGEVLQNNLATALQAQQQQISLGVGEIVSKAIGDTPELHRLLRLIPVVGSRLEQQLQSIGQRLGENITAGLIEPFAQPATTRQPVNAALNTSASYIGKLQIDSPALEALVESMVFESLAVIRQQVKVQHWKLDQATQEDPITPVQP
jgi:hypothetical protein